MSVIATIEQLEAIYGQPNEASTVKVASQIAPQYRLLIDASPFAALATGWPSTVCRRVRRDHDTPILVFADVTPRRPTIAASRAAAHCGLWR